jgi:RimJ/RimL family protein N-acetyltransferase
MQVILDRSPELLAWGAERIASMHGRPFPGDATAIGVAGDDGRVMGIIAFHDWQPEYRTIQVSAVADDPRWMRARTAFDLMWKYCWDVCKVDKIWSQTPARNTRALRFVWGLGFKQEAVIERHYGDDDAVISRIFREEYDAIHARRPAAMMARHGKVQPACSA